MNKTLLYNYLPTVGIETGRADILYSFSSGSGNLVFNELYSNSEHFMDDDTNYINGSIYPGITTGDGNPSLSTTNGTGRFNKNDGIVISPYYKNDNWTFFINFSGVSVPTGNKGTVLISSAKNTYVSALTDSDNNKFLQVSEAASVITSGGYSRPDLRTIYNFTGDSSTVPSYEGSSWPYVYVQGTLSSDDSVSATLTTSGHKGKRILLINGSPAYQYANDSRTNTADGVGVVGAWSGFKDDGSAQVNSLAGGGNPSSTACKGFTLGINYSNRPYFEYKTTSGETKIFTASKELRDKNIISLSKSDDSISLQLHDYLHKEQHFQNFDFSSDFNNSEFWNIGKFSESAITYEIMEGFSGHIEDFLLFSGDMNSGVREKISDSFMMSSFVGERAVGVDKLKNQITGTVINFTGVTGSGITGYQNVFVSNINGEDVFIKSGLTGPLTGGMEKTFLTGYLFPYTEQILTGALATFDDTYINSYGQNNITIFDKVNSTERYELYSQLSYNSGVGLEAGFNQRYSGFKLDDGYSDSSRINVYRNGYAQYSGVDYEITSNNIVFNNYASSSSDVVIYDYSLAGTDQDISGFIDASFAGTFTFTGEKYFHKDIYLNGKKLTEGYNYLREWGGQDTVIQRSTLQETGTFLFMPRVNGNTPTGVWYFNTKTGYGTNRILTNFSLISEQLWVSGLRLRDNHSYSVVSSNSNLLNSSFISGFTDIIYENEGNFLNI